MQANANQQSNEFSPTVAALVRRAGWLGQVRWTPSFGPRNGADQGWASIHVSDYSGDPNQPHSFYFERGSRLLAEQILKRLAPHCGAFILAPHSGDRPSIIATT